MAGYVETLAVSAKKRYLEKIQLINGIDPYTIKQNNIQNEFPPVNLWSIGKYFVYSKSAYTSQDFNAYKSLQAYNHFQCGWVKEVFGMKIKDKFLIIGKVMHSQKLKENPANPWVIAAADGEIDVAHCTCLAGLGEACSHIGAVLFYVAERVKHEESRSVTDKPAYWISPAGLKKAKMEKASKINFSHPLKQLKKTCTGNTNNKKVAKEREVSELTDEQLTSFLTKISDIDAGTSNPPAILTIVAPYNDKYVVNLSGTDPCELRHMFNMKYEELSLKELQQISDGINLVLTAEQCERIKSDTIQQAKSKLWYRYRAGRITASIMKRCCKTSLQKPSISLVKQIVYPEKMKFVTVATAWGCSHEKVARETYIATKSNQHKNFQVRDSGLIINACYPYLGATPDALVYCDCCGSGCLEIKCPYCLRDASPEEVAEGANFLSKNMEVQINKDHAYYYQCQTQIFIGQFKYCDFVAYTQKSLFIQRLFGDNDFWKEIVEKASAFFKVVILPELLGKAWTRCNSTTPKENQPCPSASSCTNDKKPVIVHL